MILYKYYSLLAGLEALKSGKIGFRRPDKFNDPFEFSSLSNLIGHEDHKAKCQEIIRKITSNSVVLSLTRTPTNPLMWAHYSKESTGIVVAYDFSSEDMHQYFCNFRYNLVPAVDGDVIYTGQKVETFLTDLNSERLNVIEQQFDALIQNPDGNKEISIQNIDAYAFMKKIMLVKHCSWSYEEEVRIVKMFPLELEEKTIDSYFRRVEAVDGLFLYSPLETDEWKANIHAVYFGARIDPSNILNGKLPSEIKWKIDEVNNLKNMLENVKTYRMIASAKSWEFTMEELHA